MNTSGRNGLSSLRLLTNNHADLKIPSSHLVGQDELVSASNKTTGGRRNIEKTRTWVILHSAWGKVKAHCGLIYILLMANDPKWIMAIVFIFHLLNETSIL